MQIKEFQSEENAGERIDKFLTEKVPELSRSYIQKLIKEKNVKVNSTVIKSNYKVTKGDQIQITIPDLTEPDILPENIPLDILYEDDDILVVNKPKGMVVHPAAGHYTGTLVNAIMYHCKDRLSGINGVMRPGIVHRIDMDTTGSLLVCKNDTAHQILAEQLKEEMSAFDIDAKIVERKKYQVVYIKEGAQIVDFLNVIGAHMALMEFENVRIVKEVRNSVNRQVNCETANITKIVNTAARQIEDIKYIQCNMGFGTLSDGLREIAELRLEYPDSSLQELGKMLDNPISKSGVNHRLKKLSNIANELRQEKEGIS